MSSIESEEFTEKYRKLLEDELENVDKHLKSDDWKFVKEKNDAKIYSKKKADSSFLMFMADTEVKDTTCKDFYEFFLGPMKAGNLKRIKEINPNTKDCSILRTVEPDKFFIIRISLNSNSWVVSDREFVCARRVDIADERIIILSMSLLEEDNKLVEVGRKNVRGIMYYLLVMEKQGKDVRIRNLGFTDPGGNIPAMIFNRFAYDSCTNICRFRDFMYKERQK